MPNASFQPGFRCSIFDALILATGLLGAFWLRSHGPWLGFVIAFVVGHFFLFCNVFRISRVLELVWTTIYIAVTLFIVRSHAASWTPMALLPLVTTVFVIGIELRKPSYHGIGWQRINPDLPEWWEANQHP